MASASKVARALAWLAALGTAALVAAPLLPGLTPNWPERAGLAPLLLGAAWAALGIAVVLRHGPAALTPRLLLLCGAFPLYALYTGNGRVLTSGDNLATRFLPTRFLTSGSIDLKGIPPFDEKPLPYPVVRVGDRVLSAFPLGTSLLALPHRAVALAGARGRIDEALLGRWEKHAAALLTIGAVVLFYLAVRRFGRAPALGATAVLALATPVPASAAQSLWTFTGELPCVALALYLLLARASPALAGAAMGLAFFCRPTALLFAAIVGVGLAARDRRSARRYAGGLLLAVLLVATVQQALYGHPLGAYGRGNTSATSLNRALLDGLLGVLVSPSRGLLPFFPYVLLLPIGLAAIRRQEDPELETWWKVSTAAVLLSILLTASYAKWWGGHSLGPRLLTEAAPFLALATLPLWRAGPGLRTALASLVSVSAMTQLFLCYRPAVSDWNWFVLDVQGATGLWDVAESQLVGAWTPGWTPPGTDEPSQARALQVPEDLELLGSIDAPAEDERVTGDLVVKGWARMPDGDLDVYFLLDDRIRRPTRFRRVPRPDVATALPRLGDCSTAGYEATFELPGDPGSHRLVAVFRARNGSVRHYPVRKFQTAGR